MALYFLEKSICNENILHGKQNMDRISVKRDRVLEEKKEVY